MLDAAMAGNRLIGMIQPALTEVQADILPERPALAPVGCIGRITSFTETGMDAIRVACRRLPVPAVGRGSKLQAVSKLSHRAVRLPILRIPRMRRRSTGPAFFRHFGLILKPTSWKPTGKVSSVHPTLTLVNSLSMMSPFGPAEKQALLEAPDLKTRAETLIAITEIVLARTFGEGDTMLQ